MNGKLTAPLATLAVDVNGKRSSYFGGVIFYRSGLVTVNSLNDVKGKTIAVPAAESLGGYQMQAYELDQVGVHLPKDARLVVTDMPHDNDVVSDMLTEYHLRCIKLAHEQFKHPYIL